jgi:hypothetical protein
MTRLAEEAKKSPDTELSMHESGVTTSPFTPRLPYPRWVVLQLELV